MLMTVMKILNFEKEMKTLPVADIALPTGVKGLWKYTSKHLGKNGMFTNTHKGTPVHVKASIKYNDLLKYYDLENVEFIKNGNKIKWTYLKQNPFNISEIAFKGYDDPPQILDFIKRFIDHDKLYKSALEKKIRMFYEALQWDMPIDKANTLERFF